MNQPQARYRYGTPPMPFWRRVPYRFGIRASFGWVLVPEYGGRRLCTRFSRAHYIGRAAHDWHKLASILDDVHRTLDGRVNSDFRLHRTQPRKIDIGIIGEPPGLAQIARRLGLDQHYAFYDDQRSCYFWYERTILLTGRPESAQFRLDLCYALCMALFDGWFGISRQHAWVRYGYSVCVASILTRPDATIVRDTQRLAHLVKVADEGKLLTLRDLISGDDPLGNNYAERGSNEQCTYFIHYLRSLAEQMPQAWDVVPAYISYEIACASEMVERLETAFGCSMEAIDARFLAWCKNKRSWTTG